MCLSRTAIIHETSDSEDSVQDVPMETNPAAEFLFGAFDLRCDLWFGRERPKSPPSLYKHVVLDTNALMGNLQGVGKILSEKEFVFCKLFLPWRVVCELDKLKNDQNQFTAYRARKAQNALEDWLTNKCHKIIYQSGTEDQRVTTTFKIESPDDIILQCCINLKNELRYKLLVTLFTYDKNLTIKARVSDISIFKTKSVSQKHNGGKFA